MMPLIPQSTALKIPLKILVLLVADPERMWFWRRSSRTVAPCRMASMSGLRPPARRVLRTSWQYLQHGQGNSNRFVIDRDRTLLRFV
jgi:hypothetical protein